MTSPAQVVLESTARSQGAEAVARAPEQERAHVAVLDGIRGLAVLIVLLFHTTVLLPATRVQAEYSRLFQLGEHGVDLFFVLSGFLITGILLDAKARPEGYYRSFYARRVLRIFPLYYALIAFSFLLLPALMGASPIGARKLARFAPPGDWLWYVTYLSNLLVAKHGTWRHGVLDVSWSLSIEEQFYAVWPLVVMATTPRSLRRVCALLIAGAFVTRVAMVLAGASQVAVYVFTFARMDALAMGALLASLAREPDYQPARAVRAARGTLAAAGAAILAFFVVGWTDRNGAPWMTVGYTLIALAFAALLVLVVHAPPGGPLARVFAGRFLAFMGKYSYAIYLFHLPIRSMLRDLVFKPESFARLPGGAFVGQALFYALAGTAAVVPAVASWHLLEKRFLGLKRYFPR